MSIQSIMGSDVYSAEVFATQKQAAVTGTQSTTTATTKSERVSMDTYTPEDTSVNESIGLYKVVTDASGAQSVELDSANQGSNAAAQIQAATGGAGGAGGAGAAGGSSSTSSTDDTDDLEDEIEELEEEREELQEQLQSTQDETEKAKLEKQISQLDSQIQLKQSQLYESESESEE
jgi:coenzyme F420-reducing hydrogenase alpha subunit